MKENNKKIIITYIILSTLLSVITLIIPVSARIRHLGALNLDLKFIVATILWVFIFTFFFFLIFLLFENFRYQEEKYKKNQETINRILSNNCLKPVKYKSEITGPYALLIRHYKPELYAKLENNNVIIVAKDENTEIFKNKVSVEYFIDNFVV